MRILLYNLRSKKNGESEIRIDLTNCLTDFNNHQTDTLEIKLPSGTIRLFKWAYLNKPKVYDDGKVFFIVANKQLSTDYAFEILMKYAIQKIDFRIESLNKAKEKYQKEIAA